METVFKILQLLVKNKVSFCIQSQPKWNFFNVMVMDMYGKSHYLTGDMETVSKGLTIIWGHLLTGGKPNVVKPAIPAPTPIRKGMPLPPGI